MQFIDSHAHLDFEKDLTVRAAIIERAKAANVKTVSIGTSPEDLPIIRDIAAEYPQWVAYTAGIHPCEVKENWREQVAALEKFLSDNMSHIAPVGIGEIGLDYFRLEEKTARDVVEWQRAALAAQLSIVKETGLPLVIHSRGEGAYNELIATLDKAKVNWNKVVFHCYSEGAPEVRELNARGGRASFTGIITFKNGQKMRDALIAQGLDRLMVETDSPFLAPEPHRGKTNEPSMVPLVARKAAELLQVPYEKAAEVAYANTLEFYGLKW